MSLSSKSTPEGVQAVYDRDIDTGLVHHSDRGSQYLSIRYSERLATAGIEASVGSRGDAYDNALAESVIGLFKTEVTGTQGRGAVSTTWSTPRSNGSRGSTRAGCSNRSATFPQRSTKRSLPHSTPPQWAVEHSTN